MGTTALLGAAAVAGPALAQEIRLRLLFWGGQARADRTYAATDLYTKANPGTVFDGEFMAFADYWPKLGTQVAGGNAPDIIQMDYRYIVEYANRNAIAPARRLRRQGAAARAISTS
jgi:multiple sugar transport system substrate-binding protein